MRVLFYTLNRSGWASQPTLVVARRIGFIIYRFITRFIFTVQNVLYNRFRDFICKHQMATIRTVFFFTYVRTSGFVNGFRRFYRKNKKLELVVFDFFYIHYGRRFRADFRQYGRYLNLSKNAFIIPKSLSYDGSTRYFSYSAVRILRFRDVCLGLKSKRRWSGVDGDAFVRIPQNAPNCFRSCYV